jgi:small subunit ribosomal protein S2
MVVIDVAREHIAVQEANKLNLPVVALVDSNCNPDQIEYVIPGNDDALRSIKVIMDTLAAAVGDGLSLNNKKRQDKAEKAAQAAAPAEKDKDDDDDDKDDDSAKA